MYIYYKVYTMVSTMLPWQPNLGLFITTYLSIRSKFGWKSNSIKTIRHGNYKNSREINHCVKNVIQETDSKEMKGHSHSLWMFITLESPTIFLPPPFSYNYPSRSFLCMSNFPSLLNYTNLMTLNTLYIVHIKVITS